MGDMGDFWRDVKPGMKERSQQKRASNRQSSAELLAARGVRFVSKNGGAHLVVSATDTSGPYFIDFWPGTGRWMTRGWRFGVDSRGVRRLLRHLEEHGGLSTIDASSKKGSEAPSGSTGVDHQGERK